MNGHLALIGFGEAALAFAPALIAQTGSARAFDVKTEGPAAADKWREFRDIGVTGCASLADAIDGASCILSLVTADQARIVAEDAAAALAPDALWFDCNSVAPETKRAASRAIEAAGGRYVDVAVMAPVLPARSTVPLLVSGPHAAAGCAMLAAIGFTRVRAVPGDVGRASSIKMIRSVMVKGIEALTAECMIAAEAAGVLADVIASLDASPPPPAWEERADYNLDRMLVHGLRRAAEMEEAVKTLDALGTGSAATRGTVDWQRRLGAIGLTTPPHGLDRKIAAVLGRQHEEAA